MAPPPSAPPGGPRSPPTPRPTRPSAPSAPDRCDRCCHRRRTRARSVPRPGPSQISTNVSVGDLTAQSMADTGDAYVQAYGPTTIVQNGQRYLDLPSMPLIPTYTASPDGRLDPLGSTENQDPTLGEVLLDF